MGSYLLGPRPLRTAAEYHLREDLSSSALGFCPEPEELGVFRFEQPLSLLTRCPVGDPHAEPLRDGKCSGAEDLFVVLHNGGRV